MSWVKHPLVLEGELVRLEPLMHAHIPGLVTAGCAPEIWANLPLDGSNAPLLEQELKSAILQRVSGQHYPFAIIDRQSGDIIGSTRLFDLFPQHRKLEIGWTWYTPAYWGKRHNTECKLLLLTHCFEVLQTQRVQLKTRVTNERSRAAIRKIGGVEEGVLRKDRVMPNGETRDTVLFSIIDDEWPQTKLRLQQLLAP